MTDHPHPIRQPDPSAPVNADDAVEAEVHDELEPGADVDASPAVDAPAQPEPTQARRWLWVVGFAVGGYMVAQGIYGLLTGG